MKHKKSILGITTLGLLIGIFGYNFSQTFEFYVERLEIQKQRTLNKIPVKKESKTKKTKQKKSSYLKSTLETIVKASIKTHNYKDDEIDPYHGTDPEGQLKHFYYGCKAKGQNCYRGFEKAISMNEYGLAIEFLYLSCHKESSTSGCLDYASYLIESDSANFDNLQEYYSLACDQKSPLACKLLADLYQQHGHTEIAFNFYQTACRLDSSISQQYC